MNDGSNVIGAVLICVVIFFVYFLPCIIASNRKVATQFPIFLINLFFGWSGIGWIIALLMACFMETKLSRDMQSEVLAQIRESRQSR